MAKAPQSSLSKAMQASRKGGCNMKADRLERKTHFKKMNSLPQEDVVVYDMTQSLAEVYESTALTSLMNAAHLAQSHHDFDQQFESDDEAYASIHTQYELLLWTVDLLGHSPLAQMLLEKARASGWRVGLTQLNNQGYYLDVEQRTLLLDHFGLKPASLAAAPYFRNMLVTMMIRALRDIHHEISYGAFEDAFGPEDVLMLERLRAADCDTVTVATCWELRGAGFGEIWRHFLGTSEGDMAVVFTRYLERDPTSLFDGSALAYAFRQWFADDQRVDSVDHATLEFMDDLLLERDERAVNPFGETRLTASMIEELGSLPDGSVYLAGMGKMIMKDPYYGGLHDPINQTHFFHLMYDLEVTMVNNVPFRDAKLAALIFPQEQLIEDLAEDFS
jgi:hypothetical protein